MNHNNINVYVVGPPKSGKSKIINSIGEKLDGSGCEIHEGLEISDFLANVDVVAPAGSATLKTQRGNESP
jgi:nucleoside-triphosphatase THEP1